MQFVEVIRRRQFTRHGVAVAFVLLLFVGIILYVEIPRPTKVQTPSTTSSDRTWDSVVQQVALDTTQIRNASAVGNQADVAIATASLQRHCHAAEPLQYHPGQQPGTSELAVMDGCEAFGFALPALP